MDLPPLLLVHQIDFSSATRSHLINGQRTIRCPMGMGNRNHQTVLVASAYQETRPLSLSHEIKPNLSHGPFFYRRKCLSAALHHCISLKSSLSLIYFYFRFFFFELSLLYMGFFFPLFLVFIFICGGGVWNRELGLFNLGMCKSSSYRAILIVLGLGSGKPTNTFSPMDFLCLDLLFLFLFYLAMGSISMYSLTFGLSVTLVTF